jgi:hypothetical protein
MLDAGSNPDVGYEPGGYSVTIHDILHRAEKTMGSFPELVELSQALDRAMSKRYWKDALTFRDHSRKSKRDSLKTWIKKIRS